jgi:hypothetical protein
MTTGSLVDRGWEMDSDRDALDASIGVAVLPTVAVLIKLDVCPIVASVAGTGGSEVAKTTVDIEADVPAVVGGTGGTTTMLGGVGAGAIIGAGAGVIAELGG